MHPGSICAAFCGILVTSNSGSNELSRSSFQMCTLINMSSSDYISSTSTLFAEITNNFLIGRPAW